MTDKLEEKTSISTLQIIKTVVQSYSVNYALRMVTKRVF